MALWFTQAVFRWRSIACCLWLVLLGVPGLISFKLAISTLTWQPWTVVPSFRYFIFMCFYLSLLWIITVVYSFTYTAKLPIFKTRLEALLYVFYPKHSLVILSLSLTGTMSSYCLTELTGYASGLWDSCRDNRINDKCLNEYMFFCGVYGAVYTSPLLVYCISYALARGMYSKGLCYGGKYYFQKENFLAFPSLQKHRLFRLRGHLTFHLWDGFVWTLKVLRLYYPLYYLCGSWIHMHVVNLLGLSSPGKCNLNTIAGLLDIGLLAHLILVGTFLHLSWSFALRLFRIYQTQTVVFPVVATFSEDNNQLLEVALTSDLLLLKLLGFLDLYQLSLHSPQRRKQVFSLSATGQPIVWNVVCDECLKLIKSLTNRLTSSAKEEKGFAKVSPESSFEPTKQANPSYSSQVTQNGKGWPSFPVREIVATPGATRRHALNEKARLWSYSPGESVEKVSCYHSKEKRPSPVAIAYNQIKSFIHTIPKRLNERLKKKPFFIYFLNELPDTSNQELFADCQLQVWAVTSISELAVASYNEDMFGVVQRSLSSIVGSLVDLSQALDKYVKAPLSSSKSTRNVRVALETNGRYAIKTAVQTALFRLASTFSKERRSLQLSSTSLLYWNKYFKTD